MNMAARQVYHFEDLELGMEASFAKTVSAGDTQAFAEITGDWNPVHLDADFAAKTVFRQPIAHGILTAGYISAVFGSVLAFVMYFKLAQSQGPARAALTGVVIPVIALAISALLEGWVPTPQAFAGMALCLGGVWLANRR